MTSNNRKEDQRTRLLRAMIDLSAKAGYAQASVAQVVAQARVSRSTFYEQFEDKHTCFRAAQRDLGERLLTRAEQAASTARTEREATDAVLGVLVGFAEEDPSGARVLMNEALAAGRHAMDLRDTLIAQIASVLERAWDDANQEREQCLDVPAQAIVGGTFRLISIRILRGIGSLHGMLPELQGWAGSYTRDGGTPRWRRLGARERMSPLPRSSYADLPESPPPQPLPPGRHGLTPSYVSRNQRERILHAGGETILRKGYAGTKVADIVGAAHLTRAVFYSHFRDKQELFLEIQQIHFQQTMAISARAFFSETTWPERVWEGVRAIADLFATNPVLAHFGALESHVVGTESVRLYTTDAMMAYSVFLEEGYRQRPEGLRLAPLCSEAIACTLFETIYLETRQKRLRRLPDLIPAVAYLALAPFLGPEQAGEIVEGKLRELAEVG